VPDYIELRCCSAFSFLEGASSPEDLVQRAAELGYPALALADREGLYGIPRFHQAAQSAGLRAIVGARLTLEPKAERPTRHATDFYEAERPTRRATPVSAPDRCEKAEQGVRASRRSEARWAARPLATILLLVESQQGYRNLSRLLTLAHARGPKGHASATWDEVEAHAAGLVCLLRGDASLGPSLLERARGVFGPGCVQIDVSRHLDRTAEAHARRATALAETFRIPLVATNDVRHTRRDGRRLLDVLTCLREKTTLDRAGRRLAPNAERHLLSREEMTARFADRPEWLRATRRLAERCAFTLQELGYRFPTFPVPGGETQVSWLWRLTFAGARERYGDALPSRARAQLEHELGIIEKLDLAGYFLIVHDIARFAREQGILAQGRGSAANSAVCYALGITAVDAVGMELLFERFLSEERGEWPDIDLDLPSGDKREQVIRYVFDRYGAHGAAMTATVISYRTRLAVREMGKVLGLELDTIDRLSKVLATLGHREDLDELHALLRQGGVDPEAPRIALLTDLIDRVRGLPRHLGQHTGGIVIAAGRLDEVVPIEPAAMEGRRVIQWDKDDCADLGIIKIDLLGLGMLDALEQTIRLVREHERVEIDLAHLPPDDPPTYAMIGRADTVGVFQIESRAQMATLPRMKPERFYDLVVEVAIIRPGPIVGQMVHPYLERRAGRQPVRYPHPSLEPILRRTLGVPLFQEQLLRIAMTAAGFSGGEAEELRRAMGFKRSQERMAQLEQRLREGMTARGIVGEAQQEIVRGITSFALYGFPESHAASFALLAYASAYLKAHRPAAFLAGLLNAYPLGFYSAATLVQDARRHGVAVRPIDVAHSNWACTLEPTEAELPTRRATPASAPNRCEKAEQRVRASRRSEARWAARPPGTTNEKQPALRIGLRFVAGLREEAGRAIEAERCKAPFTGVADLARRAGLRRDELLVLAELDALAHIDPGARTRRSALWQVSALERDARSLFAGVAPPPLESPLPEMTPTEETLADYRSSSVTPGPHVMAHLRPHLRARGLFSAAELQEVRDGRFVRTAGHVIVRQRPGSAKGFCFLTLEDETGTSNAILTPDVFRRFRVPLHTHSIVEIAGPLQNLEGVIHVRVRHLAPLYGRKAMPSSHDYR
jgi:error-prone DNA polymerase